MAIRVIASKTARIPMTTSNSIKVKPFCVLRVLNNFMDSFYYIISIIIPKNPCQGAFLL